MKQGGSRDTQAAKTASRARGRGEYLLISRSEWEQEGKERKRTSSFANFRTSASSLALSSLNSLFLSLSSWFLLPRSCVEPRAWVRGGTSGEWWAICVWRGADLNKRLLSRDLLALLLDGGAQPGQLVLLPWHIMYRIRVCRRLKERPRAPKQPPTPPTPLSPPLFRSCVRLTICLKRGSTDGALGVGGRVMSGSFTLSLTCVPHERKAGGNKNRLSRQQERGGGWGEQGCGAHLCKLRRGLDDLGHWGLGVCAGGLDIDTGPLLGRMLAVRGACDLGPAQRRQLVLGLLEFCGLGCIGGVRHARALAPGFLKLRGADQPPAPRSGASLARAAPKGTGRWVRTDLHSGFGNGGQEGGVGRDWGPWWL